MTHPLRCNGDANYLFKHIIDEELNYFWLIVPNGHRDIDWDGDHDVILDNYIEREFRRNTLAHLVYNHIRCQCTVTLVIDHGFARLLVTCKLLCERNNEQSLVWPYTDIRRPDDGILRQFNEDFEKAGSSIHLRAENNQIDLLCNGTKVTCKDLSSGERLI